MARSSLGVAFDARNFGPLPRPLACGDALGIDPSRFSFQGTSYDRTYRDHASGPIAVMVAVRGFTTVDEQLAGGTVQGIFGANPWADDRRDSWNEITAYAIQDVTVDGAKLTAVARSATGDDDGALLRGLLKGDDHVELGDRRDVILAHGGRDRIRGAPTASCTAGMATT